MYIHDMTYIIRVHIHVYCGDEKHMCGPSLHDSHKIYLRDYAHAHAIDYHQQHGGQLPIGQARELDKLAVRMYACDD